MMIDQQEEEMMSRKQTIQAQTEYRTLSKSISHSKANMTMNQV